MTIVLVGPHGAGKSTLGRALAKRLGIPFHDEIGHRLALDPSWRPSGATAADPQTAFDRAVFEEELARDAAWDPREPRVVETWHPGNLAYAARRSGALVDQYLPRVIASVRRFDVLVVPVAASLSTLAARQSEPGDVAFFASVGTSAFEWCRRLGLRGIDPVCTDLLPGDEPCTHVVREWRRASEADFAMRRVGDAPASREEEGTAAQCQPT